MSAFSTSTQHTQALVLLKRQGLTRLAEANEAGVTVTKIMVRKL